VIATSTNLTSGAGGPEGPVCTVVSPLGPVVVEEASIINNMYYKVFKSVLCKLYLHTDKNKNKTKTKQKQNKNKIKLKYAISKYKPINITK